jgi:hypothetical protein
MPSLFRFLMVIGTICAVVSGAMYVLATTYEPDLREETKVVPGIKIRKQ